MIRKKRLSQQESKETNHEFKKRMKVRVKKKAREMKKNKIRKKK